MSCITCDVAGADFTTSGSYAIDAAAMAICARPMNTARQARADDPCSAPVGVGIGRAVDPVERAAEVHRVCAERIGWIATLHVPRHIRLPRDHLRRRRPIRIFFFRGDLVRALPLEAEPGPHRCLSVGRAVALNEIEAPLCRIDDDGAWRIFALHRARWCGRGQCRRSQTWCRCPSQSRRRAASPAARCRTARCADDWQRPRRAGDRSHASCARDVSTRLLTIADAKAPALSSGLQFTALSRARAIAAISAVRSMPAHVVFDQWAMTCAARVNARSRAGPSRDSAMSRARSVSARHGWAPDSVHAMFSSDDSDIRAWNWNVRSFPPSGTWPEPQ